MDNLNIHTFFALHPHTSNTQMLYFNSVSSIAFRNIKLITFQTLQNQTHLKYLAELPLEFQYNSDGLVTPRFAFVVFDDVVACYFNREACPYLGQKLAQGQRTETAVYYYILSSSPHTCSLLCVLNPSPLSMQQMLRYSRSLAVLGLVRAVLPSQHVRLHVPLRLYGRHLHLDLPPSCRPSSDFPGHRFSFRVPARDPSGWICPQTQGDRPRRLV